LEATVAIQIERKIAWRKGLQGEAAGSVFDAGGFFTKSAVLENCE
jgi:hypothetical protein